MPAFIQKKRIRFQHCDPAGLIFYPKVFELAGELIEDWFHQWSGRTTRDYHLIEHRSLPTVRTGCEFFDQVRLSDEIEFRLVLDRLGRSSIDVRIDALRAGSLCFQVRSTLVQVKLDADGRYGALPFTDELRGRLLGYADATPDASQGRN